MWRARRSQRDLFDEAPLVAELRPDLQNNLGLLLQALLAEAASLQQHRTESLDGGEAGDDQNHT
jgi:hypothetical protein